MLRNCECCKTANLDSMGIYYVYYPDCFPGTEQIEQIEAKITNGKQQVHQPCK